VKAQTPLFVGQQVVQQAWTRCTSS